MQNYDNMIFGIQGNVSIKPRECLRFTLISTYEERQDNHIIFLYIVTVKSASLYRQIGKIIRHFSLTYWYMISIQINKNGNPVYIVTSAVEILNS
jgi:hypothetical protein